MSKCKSDDIERYFRNAMSDAEEIEFQKHLLHCENCRRELEKYRKLAEVLAESDRVGERVHHVPFVVRYGKWLAAASVIALVGIGTLIAIISQKNGNDGVLPNPNDTYFGDIEQNSSDSLTPQKDTVLEIVTPAKEEKEKHFARKTSGKANHENEAESEEELLMPMIDEPVHYAKEDTFEKK